MSFINMSVPAVGDPTDQQFAADAIANLGYLYNQFLSVVGNREIVLNGSFESDADANNSPDGWVQTPYTGGTFLWDESTVAGDGKAWHGKRSAKWTSPGGATKGGGTLTTETFFEVTEGRPYKIQFATKSSVADVHNTVAIVWFDSTQALISTETFYNNAASNPTSWAIFEYVVKPAANARYAKLVFAACVDDDTTAGSTWWDDVRIFGHFPAFERRCMFNAAGSFKFKVPADVASCVIICVGAGGGGGGSDGGTGGGGGGGGGMSWDIQILTPGSSYAFTVGAAGPGGSGAANGTTGGTSSFTGVVSLSAVGGTGGQRNGIGGAGGAGGTASGGKLNTAGATGATRVTTTGGDGGEQPTFGGYGLGGTAGNPGTLGPGYGGGGGGSGSTGGTSAGGNGSSGFVLILF